MSSRQQRKAAKKLTPVLVELFEADVDAVNIRFHSYPPTQFAVGGKLLADRVPMRRFGVTDFRFAIVLMGEAHRLAVASALLGASLQADICCPITLTWALMSRSAVGCLPSRPASLSPPSP